VDHQQSPDSQVVVVYATTDPAAGSRAAHLPRRDRRRGFKVARSSTRWVMRCSSTGELVFEDCEIPEENLLWPLSARA